MNNPYIHSIEELPKKCNILIYGAGGRGHLLYETTQQSKSIKVSGFIDSFKNGTFFGLPVFPIHSLSKLLDTPEMANTLIVIASAFHRKIVQKLEAIGIDKYFIFLAHDGLPLVDLPIEDISGVLGEYKHPLVFTRKPDGDCKTAKGEYLRCNQLQKSNVYFRPSGLSVCCWMPDLAEIQQGNNNNSENFQTALNRLDAARRHLCDALDNKQNPFCQACPGLFKTSQRELSSHIGGLSLDTSIHCNLNCSYCIVKNSWQCVEYDFMGLCNYILDQNLVRRPFVFDWGGAGEPTINPAFEDVTKKLIACGGTGLVFTNALKYSKVISENVNNRLKIVCSIDCRKFRSL